MVTNKSGLYGSDQSCGNSLELETMRFSTGEYKEACASPVVTSVMLP